MKINSFSADSFREARNRISALILAKNKLLLEIEQMKKDHKENLSIANSAANFNPFEVQHSNYAHLISSNKEFADHAKLNIEFSIFKNT